MSMNKELLAERKKFKESFNAVHSRSASSKKSNDEPASGSSSQKKPEKKASSTSAQAKLDLAQIKQMGGGSQFKFGVLTKIVRHMKTRHLDGKSLLNIFRFFLVLLWDVLHSSFANFRRGYTFNFIRITR